MTNFRYSLPSKASSYHPLPGPRKQGTTIMAVTHDDRYFPVADTVVKMEFKAMVEGTAR